MKRWVAVIGILIVLGLVGYVAGAHLSGGAFPVPGVELGGDRGELRRRTLAFLEDLKFKDFERAASHHAPERRETIDIPYLIERTFVVKPEVLDILDYDIAFAEVDSTGDRGRVKARVRFRELVRGQAREQEVILYWHRAGPDAPWFMELESSLRRPVAEEGKRR